MKYLCKIILSLQLLLCFTWGCSKHSLSGIPILQAHEDLHSRLGLDSTCIFTEYNSNIPGIKALFYIVDEKKDTFQYAVTDKDSIFLWAIVYTDGIHMIKELE